MDTFANFPSPSPTSSSSPAADALNDLFGQLYAFFEMLIRRFTHNLYESFAQVSAHRWTKVILCVVGYILIRPYIEAFFRKMHERDRRKQQEKERAKAAASKGKRAKVSPNSLRGGSGGEAGKVLGEVENTDDEIEEDAEEFAKASGVPEWGKNTRKRMKKYRKNLEKEAEQHKNGPKLSGEQLLELLDWSESEEEKKD